MTVPIPECLSHLPVQAGLAVPVVALRRGDRYLISVNHVRRAEECIAQGRCGICGRRLSSRAVVLTAQPDLTHATDPANHPECVAYAVQACPMLNGRQTRYRDQGAGHIAGSCDLPGCECGGYAIAAGPQHTGEPAPARWYAVRLARYSRAVDEHGKPFGIAWDLDNVLAMREVPRLNNLDQPTVDSEQETQSSQ